MKMDDKAMLARLRHALPPPPDAKQKAMASVFLWKLSDSHSADPHDKECWEVREVWLSQAGILHHRSEAGRHFTMNFGADGELAEAGRAPEVFFGGLDIAQVELVRLPEKATMFRFAVALGVPNREDLFPAVLGSEHREAMKKLIDAAEEMRNLLGVPRRREACGGMIDTFGDDPNAGSCLTLGAGLDKVVPSVPLDPLRPETLPVRLTEGSRREKAWENRETYEVKRMLARMACFRLNPELGQKFLGGVWHMGQAERRGVPDVGLQYPQTVFGLLAALQSEIQAAFPMPVQGA